MATSLNSFVGFFDPKKLSKAAYVFKATSPKQQYGPTPEEMDELCQYCDQDSTYFSHIMDAIWSSLEVANDSYREGIYLPFKDGGINPKKKLDWKTVYKTLLIIQHMALNGSQAILNDIKRPEHMHLIQAMKNYQFRESDGTDRGANVRRRAATVLDDINDEDLEQKRQETRNRKSVYTAVVSNNHSGVGSGFQPGMHVDYKAGRCKVVESRNAGYGGSAGPMSGADMPRSSTQNDTDREYQEYLRRKHAGTLYSTSEASVSSATPVSASSANGSEPMCLAKMDAQFSNQQPVMQHVAAPVPPQVVAPAPQQVAAPVQAPAQNFFDMFAASMQTTAPIFVPTPTQQPQRPVAVSAPNPVPVQAQKPTTNDFFTDFASFQAAPIGVSMSMPIPVQQPQAPKAPQVQPQTQPRQGKKQDLDALLEF